MNYMAVILVLLTLTISSRKMTNTLGNSQLFPCVDCQGISGLTAPESEGLQKCALGGCWLMEL